MTPPSLETDFGSRLLTLADGRPGLRGCMHITAAAPADATPDTLDFIGSDASLDRYDEIVEPAG